MDCLTDQDAFTARELHARGFSAERIADLLAVDVDLVEDMLTGRPRSDVAEPRPPAVAPVPKPEPPSVDPNAWPPPVDDATEWDEVHLSNGYGLERTEVRVRWVMLWGQRVRINPQNEVWCHFCLQFKTTKELGHPYNACPVGLPHRNVIVHYGHDDEMPEMTRYQPVSDPLGWSW